MCTSLLTRIVCDCTAYPHTHTGQIKPRASHNSVYGPSNVYQIYFMSDNLRDIGPNDGPLDWQIVVCNGFIYMLLVRILVCMSVGI